MLQGCLGVLGLGYFHIGRRGSQVLFETVFHCFELRYCVLEVDLGQNGPVGTDSRGFGVQEAHDIQPRARERTCHGFVAGGGHLVTGMQGVVYIQDKGSIKIWCLLFMVKTNVSKFPSLDPKVQCYCHCPTVPLPAPHQLFLQSSLLSFSQTVLQQSSFLCFPLTATQILM